MFYVHEFSQTHERICPHELFEADPSLSLRAVILKVVNVISKVRGDQLVKCIISRGACMGKELGFHRRNISKKGGKNCGSKLRLGTYIECTDIYRSHRARDQM